MLDSSSQTELSTWHICMLKHSKDYEKLASPYFYDLFLSNSTQLKPTVIPLAPAAKEVTAYIRNEEEGC